MLALVLASACHGKRAPEPGSAPAPSMETAAGAKAPDAQVTQASGAKIALADVTQKHAQTVIVFYRGFW